MNKVIKVAFNIFLGSAFGQIVLAFALLVATHLYTPEQLGALALISSYTAIGAVILGLRLDLALPVAERGLHYSQLAWFFERLTKVVGFIGIFLVILLFCVSLALDVDYTPTQIALLMLVLGTAVTLRFDARTLMAISTRSFRHVGRANAISSIGQSLVLLLAGMTFPSAIAAVCSYIFGRALACVFPLKSVLPETPEKHIGLRTTINRYKDFPRYAMPTGLVNTLISAMPVVLITVMFDVAAAGIFFLIWRLVYSPAQLLGRSIGQVVYGESAIQKSRSDICAGTIQSLYRMTATSIGLFAVLYFISQFDFSGYLGKDWGTANEMLLPVAFVACCQLGVSPLRNILTRLGRQRRLLILQSIRFVICCSSFYLSWLLKLSLTETLWAFAISVFVSNMMLVVGTMSVFKEYEEHDIQNIK